MQLLKILNAISDLLSNYSEESEGKLEKLLKEAKEELNKLYK